MSKIAIRADGSPNIGMGHIIRCLSIAKELKRQGQYVYFISKYDEGIARIEASGFSAVRLPNAAIQPNEGFHYGDLSELKNDEKHICDILVRNNTNTLIVDSYNVSEEFFINLKKRLKLLVYIDDINKFIYPVDILINGNINADRLNYEKWSDNEIMLLGTKFNLIRDEFKNVSREAVNNDIKEILITSGSADPYNICYKIADILIRILKDIKIRIIVGTGFKNKQLLYDLASQHSNILLYENASRLSEIMLKSDLAISSGGSTLYELCACGTPTLAFLMADNQTGIVARMQELGYIKSLGWHSEINESVLLEHMNEMTTVHKRAEISKNMQAIVDGLGAYRIANEIITQKGVALNEQANK